MGRLYSLDKDGKLVPEAEYNHTAGVVHLLIGKAYIWIEQVGRYLTLNITLLTPKKKVKFSYEWDLSPEWVWGDPLPSEVERYLEGGEVFRFPIPDEDKAFPDTKKVEDSWSKEEHGEALTWFERLHGWVPWRCL